jgi:hypothetical protein
MYQLFSYNFAKLLKKMSKATALQKRASNDAVRLFKLYKNAGS